MKDMFKNSVLKIFLISGFLILINCNRPGEDLDDFPQEDLSDILLKITDESTGVPAVYVYQVNSTVNPQIKLTDGHSYRVEVLFKNGEEDVTQEIRDAKDEHFLTYNFPNSDIVLVRTDDAASTRADGAHVGLKTKWVVNDAAKNPSASTVLVLALYHESVMVSDDASVSGNGILYGAQNGGETDAEATYTISN